MNLNHKSNIHFFLHFGVGRSGTTFLQERMFKNLKGFKVVINKDDEIRLLLTKVIDDNFKNNSDINKLEKLFKESGFNKIIISDETLCYKLFKIKDFKELNKLFYRCSILITIRSQIKALESIYIETLNHRQNYLSFDDYLEKILNNNFEFSFDKLFFEVLNYEKLYNLFKLISPNIYFLPFEYLYFNKSMYKNILNEFLNSKIDYRNINFDNKINNRKSQKWLIYEKIRSKLPLKRNIISKYFNKKIRNKINVFFWNGKPAKISLSDEKKIRIMNFFEANNRKIQDISKINLKDLNYFFK